MSAQYFESFCLVISIMFDTEDITKSFRHSCIHGNVHVVDILTELFDDEIKDSKRIGLHNARHTNNVAIVERLLHVRHETNETFGYACQNGHLGIVEKLLQDDRVFESTDEDETEFVEYYYCIHLINACSKGNLAVVDLLLKDDQFDPAWDNRDGGISTTSLSEACDGGHITVVERLLQDVRVVPSYNNNFTISGMCMSRTVTSATKIAIMKLLLENDDDVNLLENDGYFGFNVLSGIFESRDIEVARWLFNEFNFSKEDIDEATEIARESIESESELFEASMLQIRALYDES